MIQIQLEGKVAVVTGATRGIGRAIAEALAKSGAKVACIGTNEEKLTKSVADIVAAGGISSISGLIGNKGQANYSASKAGLIGFTRTICKELGNRNITVNAIAPGFIETDMTAVLEEVYVNEIKARIPMGRFGQVEDVANAVLYFVSDEASFVSGQVIAIDGGMTC